MPAGGLKLKAALGRSRLLFTPHPPKGCNPRGGRPVPRLSASRNRWRTPNTQLRALWGRIGFHRRTHGGHAALSPVAQKIYTIALEGMHRPAHPADSRIG